jgi:hypothetical protein
MDRSAINAALITGLVSLTLYAIDIGARLDARLDRLEEDAKILVTPDGRIVPAPESVEALQRSLVNERRLERLEDRYLNRNNR